MPRPLASVPLGGSLWASRAALLARPLGPLTAVDLADGREVVVEDLGAGWIAFAAAEPGAEPRDTSPPRAMLAAASVRPRRLGTALVLVGTLGAAVVALATGFSGTPAPAVAGPVAGLAAARPPAAPPVRAGARDGRAAVLARTKASPPPSPPGPVPSVPSAVVPPPAAPAPPPLPALHSVSAL